VALKRENHDQPKRHRGESRRRDSFDDRSADPRRSGGTGPFLRVVLNIPFARATAASFTCFHVRNGLPRFRAVLDSATHPDLALSGAFAKGKITHRRASSTSLEYGVRD
jgi:hypothetical protein